MHTPERYLSNELTEHLRSPLLDDESAESCQLLLLPQTVQKL